MIINKKNLMIVITFKTPKRIMRADNLLLFFFVV